MSSGQKGMQKARKAWEIAEKDERDNDDANNNKTRANVGCRLCSPVESLAQLMGESLGELV